VKVGPAHDEVGEIICPDIGGIQARAAKFLLRVNPRSTLIAVVRIHSCIVSHSHLLVDEEVLRLEVPI